MASKLFPTFDSFWDEITRHLKARNSPTYHPCCRVWVSRKHNLIRESHSKTISFTTVIKSMGCSETDQKTLLHANMLENGWGTPIRLNYPCECAVAVPEPARPVQACQSLAIPAHPAGAFSLHRPVQQPPSPHSTPAPFQFHESLPPRLSEPAPVASDTSSTGGSCKNTEQ